MYITEQMYLNHQRWSNNKQKLSKVSFLPSVEHICFQYWFFVLNRSENLRNRFCWNCIILECRYNIWHIEYRSLVLVLPGNPKRTHSSIPSEMSVRKKLMMFFHQLLKYSQKSCVFEQNRKNVVYHHLHYNIDMLACFLF